MPSRKPLISDADSERASLAGRIGRFSPNLSLLALPRLARVSSLSAASSRPATIKSESPPERPVSRGDSTVGLRGLEERPPEVSVDGVRLCNIRGMGACKFRDIGGGGAGPFPDAERLCDGTGGAAPRFPADVATGAADRLSGDREGSRNGSEGARVRLPETAEVLELLDPTGNRLSTSCPRCCSEKDERGVAFVAKDGRGCSIGRVGRRNRGGVDKATSSNPRTPLMSATASFIKSLPLCAM